MATTPVRKSQRIRRENYDGCKYEWLVTVDHNSSADGRPLVGRFQLDDKQLFPKHVLIDTSEERQKWTRGQKISVMWPRRGPTGKMTHELARTEVHGLYMEKESAIIAERALIRAYDEQSRQRQRKVNEKSRGSNHSDHSDDLFEPSYMENDAMMDNNKEAHSDRSIISPSPKRRVVQKSNEAIGKILKTKRKLVLEDADEKQDKSQLAYLKEIARGIKNMQADLDIFKTQTSKEFTSLNTRLDSVESSLKVILKKQGDASKKTSAISRQLSDKVQPLAGHLSTEDALFDANSSLIYMGVDRMKEINDLFLKYGSREKQFVMALAELWYGDDMWFWMITSDSQSRRSNDRKSLQTRDPEGVKLIEKIMRTYYKMVILPRDEEFIRKSTELEAASKSGDDALVKSLNSNIKCLQRRKVDQWYSAAVWWFNSWGNNCRNRKSGHPWEDSLYGKSVRQIDTVKPPQFDMEMEQAWREKLLAAKSGEKAKKMMQQRSQENLSDGVATCRNKGPRNR